MEFTGPMDLLGYGVLLSSSGKIQPAFSPHIQEQSVRERKRRSGRRSWGVSFCLPRRYSLLVLSANRCAGIELGLKRCNGTLLTSCWPLGVIACFDAVKSLNSLIVSRPKSSHRCSGTTEFLLHLVNETEKSVQFTEHFRKFRCWDR